MKTKLRKQYSISRKFCSWLMVSAPEVKENRVIAIKSMRFIYVQLV